MRGKIALRRLAPASYAVRKVIFKYATETITLLGYHISKGVLQPDPDHVKPVLNMHVPRNSKELQRLVGLFAYHAQWIPRYSDKIRLLVAAQFPLDDNAVGAIKVLKHDLSSAALGAIDETLPFVLETDASATQFQLR